jgi:hypothetical protein
MTPTTARLVDADGVELEAVDSTQPASSRRNDATERSRSSAAVQASRAGVPQNFASGSAVDGVESPSTED